VTKADIIESVYEKVGFSKKEAAEIVEMVFDTIKETLERGEKIKISGFGNFIVRDKKSRVGRNPQTGEEIEISARRVLTFRPSQVLKNALNLSDMLPPPTAQRRRLSAATRRTGTRGHVWGAPAAGVRGLASSPASPCGGVDHGSLRMLRRRPRAASRRAQVSRARDDVLLVRLRRRAGGAGVLRVRREGARPRARRGRPDLLCGGLRAGAARRDRGLRSPRRP
jgi:integration host factor subunit alpha